MLEELASGAGSDRQGVEDSRVGGGRLRLEGMGGRLCGDGAANCINFVGCFLLADWLN
jgi:hypothetical protein